MSNLELLQVFYNKHKEGSINVPIRIYRDVPIIDIVIYYQYNEDLNITLDFKFIYDCEKSTLKYSYIKHYKSLNVDVPYEAEEELIGINGAIITWKIIESLEEDLKQSGRFDSENFINSL